MTAVTTGELATFVSPVLAAFMAKESRLIALVNCGLLRLDLNYQETVPPKRNYDFEKRRKEQDRKTKKDLKRAERQQRRDERRVDDAPTSENADSSTRPSGASSTEPET